MFRMSFAANWKGVAHIAIYDGPNVSLFISILLHNSEFRILNSINLHGLTRSNIYIVGVIKPCSKCSLHSNIYIETRHDLKDVKIKNDSLQSDWTSATS